MPDTANPWSDPIPPLPAEPDDEIGITSCRCCGEGCEDCGNTGVIYP